jgi:hypothetical protein
MVYLSATRNDGIYYWRPEPNPALPDIPMPTTISSMTKLQEHPDLHSPTKLEGASGSTWATDRQHHQSTGGIVLLCRRCHVLPLSNTPYSGTVIYQS